MKIWLLSSMSKIGTAYLQCLLSVSRVLLRNFRLLLTRSVTNLWWSWMSMYILQVSSQVKRCSLDLLRTTELRIFNELNVYKSAVAQLAVCFFFSLKKTVKTLYIIALKLFKKPLSSSLYKLQIHFIKRYTLTMHSMCRIERTKNIQIYYSSTCHC